jgi:type IV secretion system protein VirB6
MAPSGIFTFITGSIDDWLSKFVVQVSTSLAAGIAPLVVIGMTIWIVTYGIAVMSNETPDPVMVFAKKIMKNSLIFTFALNAGVYQSQIVDGVNAFTTGLVQAITLPNPMGAAPQNIFDALDQLYALTIQLAGAMVDHGVGLLPIGGYLDIIVGLLFNVASALLVLMIGGWAVIADASLKFVLAFGPLFIACLAFEPVKQFFNSWFSKIANYVMLTALLSGIGTFVTQMALAYVQNMAASTQSTTNAFSDVFGFIVLVGVSMLLTWQMPNLAASLTGGTPLSSAFMGAAAGAMMGKMGKGGGNDDKPDPAPDNKIEDKSDKKNENKSENKRVPLYRRAMLDAHEK